MSSVKPPASGRLGAANGHNFKCESESSGFGLDWQGTWAPAHSRSSLEGAWWANRPPHHPPPITVLTAHFLLSISGGFPKPQSSPGRPKDKWEAVIELPVKLLHADEQTSTPPPKPHSLEQTVKWVLTPEVSFCWRTNCKTSCLETRQVRAVGVPEPHTDSAP